jgi:thiosulfate dehydrogenase
VLDYIYEKNRLMKNKLAVVFCILITIFSCKSNDYVTDDTKLVDTEYLEADTSSIPKDEFGEMVRYGRNLMINTAYYIGPNGVVGKHLGNKMNCTNCHQNAGTKPYAYNLVKSQDRYPQYRPREGKVLTLADRVNNCIERPHNGKSLPYNSKEMTAILSYLKWINSNTKKDKSILGFENLEITFMNRAADSKKGEVIYQNNCLRCHAANGEGVMAYDNKAYQYPPLWGSFAYQSGSSIHRITKQARWLKANMPHDKATWEKPVLTDEEALDVAAFINDDEIHKRPSPKDFDYPNIAKKNIDYDRGPFIDTFSERQHKYGPFPPIIEYWVSKGWKPVY